MNGGPIKAIETRYAGCRFRSRLEARWAVFFDSLGTPWEYEPQGVYGDDGTPYLPDFWLPEMHLWAEVKGSVDHASISKVMHALPSLRQYNSHQVERVLVVLGPVPCPGRAWTHTRLDMLGDRVLWQAAFFHGPDWYMEAYGAPVTMPVDSYDTRDNPEVEKECCAWLVEASPAERLTVDPTVDAAYTAARSARFEFGESGART